MFSAASFFSHFVILSCSLKVNAKQQLTTVHKKIIFLLKLQIHFPSNKPITTTALPCITCDTTYTGFTCYLSNSMSELARTNAIQKRQTMSSSARHFHKVIFKLV